MNKFNINILSFDVTDLCNGDCIYCRDIHGKKNRIINDEDKIDILKKMISSISGLEWVKISGGEPFLFNKLFEFINICSKAGLKTILQTNGYLLNEDNIKRLKNAGLTKVQISLDGEENVHNHLRGEKSYKKVINAANKCQTLNLPFQFKCTISKYNSESLEEIFKLAKIYKPERLNFRFLIAIGKALKYKNLIVPSIDRENVIRNLYKLSQKYSIDIISGDPCSYLYLNRIKGINLHKNKTACTIGINSIHISSDGYLRPCSMLPMNLGDAMNDDIEKIWIRSDILVTARRKEYHNCRVCSNKYYCGGCRSVSFYEGNGLFGQDNTCFLFNKELK